MIQKTFNLTDGEKYLLLESGVGEGIFFAGSKHAAIKVVASYTEDQIVTTNPEQLLQIEKAKAEFDAKVEASKGEVATAAEEPPATETLSPEEQEAKKAEEAAQGAAADLLNQESAGKEEADKIRDSLSV